MVVVTVDVDIVVVCGAVGVATDVFVVNGDAVIVSDVGKVVVTGGDGVMTVVEVVSGFLGARIMNFNIRERVTANIVRTIKDMQIILTQRWCHHLRGPIFLVTYLLNSWL